MSNNLCTDKNGNFYVNVGNIRITYIPKESRSEAKNWAGESVIRIQAYRNGHNSALHSGAEYPVEGVKSIMDLIGGISNLYGSVTARPCDNSACQVDTCPNKECTDKFNNIYPRAYIEHDVEENDKGFLRAVILYSEDHNETWNPAAVTRQERKIDIYKYLIETKGIDPAAITNRIVNDQQPIV